VVALEPANDENSPSASSQSIPKSEEWLSKQLTYVPDGVCALTEDAASRTVWIGCIDGGIHVYSKENQRIVKHVKHDTRVNGIVNIMGQVWSISDDQTMIVWDTKSYNWVKKITQDAPILCVQLSHNKIYTGNAIGVLSAWNIESKQSEREYNLKEAIMCLLVDDDHIWMGTANGTVHVIKKADFKPIINWVAHSSTSRIKSLLKTEDKLWTCSTDPELKVWEKTLTKPQLIATLEGHSNGGVNTMILFNDFVVSAGFDMSIIIWDAKNLTLLHQLRGVHEDTVRTLFTSWDDSHFMSGSYDQSVVMWYRDSDRKRKKKK